MKNIRRQTTTDSMAPTLPLFRDQFREWYGLLSIDEIISNHTLIRSIERLESILRRVILETEQKVKICMT